ncbi:general substrate transporter [Cadophora sp. DSE1049]|nr:general substrate transporter [Cadophora sp. DSE1049]
MVSESQKRIVGEELAAVLPARIQPWWKTPYLLRLNFYLFSCMLFSATIGFDNSLMNGLQALDTWNKFMDHPTGAYLGAINACQAGGACIANPVMSYVSNEYGRKVSVWIGLFFLSLGTALNASAINPAMFIVSRVLVGSASGFFSAVALLVTEMAYPTHRGKMTAGFNTLVYAGSLISAWSTFGCRNLDSNWSWRIPSLLQILIPTIAFTGFALTPESPRFLISKGRNEEARLSLIKHHGGGDESSPLVAFEMAEIEQAILLEQQANESSGYMDMLKTAGNRHRLFISISMGVFSQWNGVGIVSYYLAAVLKTVGITSITQQTLINGFLQLWNLIMAVLASSLVDRIGRRPLLLASSFGMLVCITIITGLSGSFAITAHAATGLAVVPLLFIYFGFYDIAFTPLAVSYPAEIWQYSLRSRGVAVTYVSIYAAQFFNLFVNPIALESIAWKYYIVYIVIMICICVVAWCCYPETRGYSLEEIARVFDKGDTNLLPHGVILDAVKDKQMEMNSDKVDHVDHAEEKV